MAPREARLVYQDVLADTSPARKRISSERAASSWREVGRWGGRARRARAWWGEGGVRGRLIEGDRRWGGGTYFL